MHTRHWSTEPTMCLQILVIHWLLKLSSGKMGTTNVCPHKPSSSPAWVSGPTTYPAAQATLLSHPSGDESLHLPLPTPLRLSILSALQNSPRVCPPLSITTATMPVHQLPPGLHLKPLTGHPVPTVYSPPTSQRALVHQPGHVTPLGKASALQGPA